jgi:exopolysaccharide biosynthesis WecB/TagA/CpsF family protein
VAALIAEGKRSVLGVQVDVIDYEAAVEQVLAAARAAAPLAVSALAVHGVMEGVRDSSLLSRLNSLDIVAPDGQPVRWALGLLHGRWLRDRVYGPELTWRVLAAAAGEGLPVYFYGSRRTVLDAFVAAAVAAHPGLVVAGAEPSLFRPANVAEQVVIASRMRASGARVVLVGLGCPRQEVFVSALRDAVGVPMLAVGAAFDYHSGALRKPPSWMQRAGLEWLWRLGLEPRRLWRRYVLLNPAFVVGVVRQRLGRCREPFAATPTRGPIDA